jgi:hypothetical protein
MDAAIFRPSPMRAKQDDSYRLAKNHQGNSGSFSQQFKTIRKPLE